MMEERPLHVQVAEALGWQDIAETMDPGDWVGFAPPWARTIWMDVPRFDTDWSATGPLIARYSLDLYRKVGDGPWSAAAWIPNDEPTKTYKAEGATPLLAVCHLLLALHAAGELRVA